MKKHGIIWYWNGYKKKRIKFPKQKVKKSQILKFIFWFEMQFWLILVQIKYRRKIIEYNIQYDGSFRSVDILIRLSTLADPDSLRPEERKIFFTDIKNYPTKLFIQDNPLPV